MGPFRPIDAFSILQPPLMEFHPFGGQANHEIIRWPTRNQLVSLARKYLLHDKTSFLLTLTIVSLAMLLTFAMTGLYFGFIRQSELYIDKAGADVWVYSQGSPNFYYTVSFLPSSLRSQIAATPGVQAVSSVLYQGGTMRHGSRDTFVFYVTEGSGTPSTGQLVIDSFLASKLGVGVGDTVGLNQRNFTVSGIYAGPGGFLAYYVFITLGDAKELTSIQDFVNGYLVKVVNGYSSATVASSLSGIPGVQAYPTNLWAKVSSDAILANVLPPVEGMLVMGVVVAVLVVGLTNYAVTVNRQREYGILKAVGASNARLYRVVLLQSLAIALASLTTGGFMTAVAVELFKDITQSPYLFVYSPYALSYILAISFATGAIGAILPAHRVAKIDPAIAFK